MQPQCHREQASLRMYTRIKSIDRCSAVKSIDRCFALQSGLRTVKLNNKERNNGCDMGVMTTAISDEIREQRKSLKGKGAKAYLSWFWEYYKIHTLVVIVIAGMVFSVVKTIVTHKDPALEVLFINDASRYPETADEIGEQFLAEQPELHGGVMLDMMNDLTPGGNFSVLDQVTVAKILTRESSSLLDAIVADAWYFDYYAMLATFMDLRECLTQEELKALEGDLYYLDLAELKKEQEKRKEDPDYFPETISAEEAAAMEQRGISERPDPDKMQEPVPVGVYLTNGAVIGQYGLYPDAECVMGILPESQHRDAARSMLMFLHENNSKD